MAEQVIEGLPASPGEAVGRARQLGLVLETAATLPPDDRAAALAAARAALAAAGAELGALAGRLRSEDRAAEAEIVETGVLMAADPALDAALEAAVMDAGRPPAVALMEACGDHADAIAALPDAMLAARADDVRSLGRRAARHVGAPAHTPPSAASTAPPGKADPAAGPVVLVADDLGPADVAELDRDVAGVALAGGGPSAHAAVVARGLGLPMVVGLGDAVLAVADGTPLAVDGAAGTLVVRPGAETAATVAAAQERRRREHARSAATAALPSATTDGRVVRVLVNAATRAEVEAGLRAGAEGVGLLRTELGLLQATAWPDEAAHQRMLAPVLAPLAGRTATVRVLDFGADKTPAFLAGTPARGLALLLEHPDALAAQLRAIVRAAAGTDLRILLPLVESADQVEAVRAALGEAGADAPLGAMIETRSAVAAAAEIARAADFLSIGTNDLTADVLGADRFAPGGAMTHDPRVLAAIAAITAAAREAGRIVEVCGEAASEPLLGPLLVGRGGAELRVGAARVGATRVAVRALDASIAARLARRALEDPGPAAVAERVRGLLGEVGDAAAERLDRDRPVVAVGDQP